MTFLQQDSPLTKGFTVNQKSATTWGPSVETHELVGEISLLNHTPCNLKPLIPIYHLNACRAQAQGKWTQQWRSLPCWRSMAGKVTPKSRFSQLCSELTAPSLKVNWKLNKHIPFGQGICPNSRTPPKRATTHVQVGLPSSAKPFWKHTPYRHTEMCISMVALSPV